MCFVRNLLTRWNHSEDDANRQVHEKRRLKDFEGGSRCAAAEPSLREYREPVSPDSKERDDGHHSIEWCGHAVEPPKRCEGLFLGA